MRTLNICLMVFSGLFGITIGFMAFVLGMIATVDVDGGWKAGIASSVYMLHPALIYWAFKTRRENLAVKLAGFFLFCSIALSAFIL